MGILYLERFEQARNAVCTAADEFCWDTTPDNEKKLRDAVAEWRTALGLLRLSKRERESNG